MDDEIMRFHARIQAAEKRARERIAELIVREQARMIESRVTPSGSPQRANQLTTTKKKKGKGPLIEEGILGEASKWTIDVSGTSYEVEPPASRRKALAELSAMGYETLLDGLPASLLRRAQEIVDEVIALGDAIEHGGDFVGIFIHIGA